MWPNSSTASPLEVTWTTVALCGTAFAVALLAHVWLSYRTVRSWIKRGWAVRWGPRHRFVLGFLIGMALMLAVWVGFVALGVSALYTLPPVTPDREAASERAGWILVGLELALFAFQCVLLWAWITLGRPSIKSPHEISPFAHLMLEAIDAGRGLGHLVKNSMSEPIGLIDITLGTAVLTDQQRSDLTRARDLLLALVEDVDALHDEIKRMEPRS